MLVSRPWTAVSLRQNRPCYLLQQWSMAERTVGELYLEPQGKAGFVTQPPCKITSMNMLGEKVMALRTSCLRRVTA